MEPSFRPFGLTTTRSWTSSPKFFTFSLTWPTGTLRRPGTYMLLCTRAKSGVLSDYPNLGRLDRDENLAVTLDFRRVYCSLLEQWMGTDAAQVIPNAGGFGRMDLVS